MTQDTNHKNVDYRNTNYCPSLDSVGEKKQTPSEFKRLAIPYHEIEKGDIQHWRICLSGTKMWIESSNS